MRVPALECTRFTLIADARFALMVEDVRRMRVAGFLSSQVSAMDVKPPALPMPVSIFGVGNPAPQAMRC